MARISLDELRTRASTVDRAKLDATTEADIKAQQAADGDADLDVPAQVDVVEPPRALRVRLGMTQAEIAEALKIPVGTWRNWEQGRTKLEPTALALLRIVSRNPWVLLDTAARGRGQVQQVAPLAMLNAGFLDPMTNGNTTILSERPKTHPYNLRTITGAYLSPIGVRVAGSSPRATISSVKKEW